MSSMEDLSRRETVEEIERRSLLRSAILNLTEEAQQDDVNLDPELVRRSNQLAAQIKEVPEALLDSRLAVILGQKAVKASNKLSICGVNYSASEFLSHLRRILSDGGAPSSRTVASDDFSRLSQMVPRREARPKTPIVGSFHCEDLKEKQIRRRVTTQSQRPDEITEVHQVVSTEGLEEHTTKAVDRIFRAVRKLHEKGLMPVDFFEFVIDPESFSTTIENIFHLSFLVKQNQVGFSIDAEGRPSLSLVIEQKSEDDQADKTTQSRTTHTRRKNHGGSSRSAVVSGEEEQMGELQGGSDASSAVDQTVITSISFNEWREIIDAYRLSGKSIIKRLGGGKG
ncbi:EP300-interacting inhibitor of differentiation 3-like [Tropilaelaps mercedesae]|uniref:Non-structural maintenance of chromosomes element 4 n=1 Tax=Tropilaelaps mercedesae TaxID=418985 RepID=A0A1V9XLQ9_9ACAR|nr:EP300-interacting inhibitor of differentiation 3-like [Tropilaelaps mercedesae]